MNKNNQKLNHLKSLRPVKRRAGAEIIAALLLVAITVVGAVILTVFLDDNFVAASENEASKSSSSKFINLLAYDTRDSTGLLNLPDLDNFFDDKLTGSNALIPDNIPSDQGTEFIVLQIENQGVNSIWLSDVFINGISHVWDSDTASKILDVSANDVTGKYPKAGMFSILPVNSNTQNTSTEIEPGKTVNLVVKLSQNHDDILLNKSLRILLNIGENQPVDFVIESGSAK